MRWPHLKTITLYGDDLDRQWDGLVRFNLHIVLGYRETYPAHSGTIWEGNSGSQNQRVVASSGGVGD